MSLSRSVREQIFCSRYSLKDIVYKYLLFTISEIDRVLVPYCKKTLETARKEFDEWFSSSPATTEQNTNKREEYAWKKLNRELEQGFQSLELKLNTVDNEYVPCLN